MKHLRYTAADEVESKPENQLFSYWLLIAFFLLVVGSLIYLFPGNSLIKTLINQEYLSEADYRYSILLLAANNKNLISYTKINENPSAVIKQFEAMSRAQNLEVRWLNYIVLKNILYQEKISKPVKLQATQVLVSYLNSFKTAPTSMQQDIQLAVDSLAIDKAPLALYFYEQVIRKNPQQNVYFYAKIGQTALWAKQCVKSANYYLIAQEKSAMLVDKRYFYILALKILFECNEFDLAIELAEKHINGLRDDALTYQLLTELAIKANQPAKAQQFVLKLLQLKANTNKP